MDAHHAIQIVNTHIDQFNNGLLDITDYQQFIDALAIVSRLAETFHNEIDQAVDNKHRLDVRFTPQRACQLGLSVEERV